MKRVVVSSSFDDLKSPQMRFLQEAAKLGEVSAVLWPDETVKQFTGSAPDFPLAERLYTLDAIRYVSRLIIPETEYRHGTLPPGEEFDIWVSPRDNDIERACCAAAGIEYVVIGEESIGGFPIEDRPLPDGATSVIVTGCYDWFHSGHIRFFEEVSELGRVYVVVGNDENVRGLKGEGHPLFSEHERRYICDSIKYVHQAYISSGSGWLDAEPEIRRLHPDRYAVNEDGDKAEKREYCEAHGIEYVVLKRVPKEGLERRSSTDLRGF
jgi:cytidyltransferase-like protein